VKLHSKKIRLLSVMLPMSSNLAVVDENSKPSFELIPSQTENCQRSHRQFDPEFDEWGNQLEED
jgi:hypothetical protein